MICEKCKFEFSDKDLEYSHDIPKYIGGTDKDGRHLLCKKCHDNYENILLEEIFFYLFNQHPIIDEKDRRTRINPINKIKQKIYLNNYLLLDIKKLVFKFRGDFFK